MTRKLLAESLEPRQLMAANINEVHFSPLFGDAAKHQYIELRGDSLASMNAGTYLVVISSSDGVVDLGDVHSIFDLSNQQFGANGMLVLTQSSSNFTIDPAARVLTGTNGFLGMPGNIFSADSGIYSSYIRNGSNTYLLIESAIPPSLSNDIDSNDDGVPDGAYLNWTILDGFTVFPWVESVWPQKAYAPIVFQDDGVGTGMPGATLVVTEALAYVGRIGQSTGYAANDWLAGNTTEVTSGSWSFQLEDGIFGVPRPRAYAGRFLDHIGGPNWVGSISGSIFLDLNSDGVQQAGEAPVPGVQIFSDLMGDGTIELYSESIEPNRYAIGRDLTNISSNATLTTAGGDNLPINFAITPVQRNGAPAGELIFSHTGIGFFNEGRRLRTDFYRPARSISIDVIGNSNLTATYGRLEIFNANNVSLGFARTGPLLANQAQRLTMTSNSDEIAWAVAYPEESYLNSSPFGMLDNLSFELAEQSTMTDADGNFFLQPMTAGDYEIRIVPPAGYDLVFPSSETHAIRINKYESYVGRNFGLLGNLPPVVNDQTFHVNEASTAGSVISVLQFAKGFPSQILSASITSGNPAGLFSIDAITGNLTLNRAELDFETTKTYTLTVTFIDTANAALADSATIQLIIDDANESPVVTSTTKTLSENVAAGTVLVTMAAADPDAGLAGQFLWSLVAGNTGNAFAIDPTTGEVRVNDASRIDYEANPVFNLTVRATDRGTPAKSGDGSLAVTLLNVNEAPTLLDQTLNVVENSEAGTVIGTINGIDPDANDTLQWEITGRSGADLFEIGSDGKLTVATGAMLDFEETDQYEVEVTVTDAGLLTDSHPYKVNIQDANDAPTLTVPTKFTLDEDATSGFALGAATAADQDATQQLSFSLSGSAAAKFAIDSATGAITVAEDATFDYESAPSLSLTVQVTDNGTPAKTTSSVVTIELNDVNEAPSIPPISFQVPENSAADTDIGLLTATDPDAGDVLSFEIVEQTANWVTIDPTTGAFKVASNAVIDFETLSLNDVQVRVTDSGGLSVERTVQFQALDRNDPPTVLNPLSDANASAGTLFTYSIPANTVVDQDAGDSLRFFMTDSLGFPLPSWLSFNATTRVLSGTPTANDAGATQLRYTATDSAGAAASTQFTVTVTAITHPWHNTDDPLDTNDNGSISPVDALIVINYLNSGAPREITGGSSPTFGFLDTSKDNVVSPLDALLVINVLNRRGSGEGEGGGKGAGESASISAQPSQTAGYFDWAEERQKAEHELREELIELLANVRSSFDRKP